MRYYYDAALRKTVLWKSRPLLKAFNEGAHPRDAAGRFTDKGFFYTEEQRAQAVKNDLKKLCTERAVPLPDIPFTRENYNKLFPVGIIQTPICSVKLGEHQFEKLQSLNRNYLLGAVAETLKKPVAVIFEMRDGKPSLLYVKSFLTGGKYKIVQSVVVEIDGVNVSVSTHERTINNVLNKIKKADQVIYKDTNSQPND
ncbi:hypothetical protein [Treponema pedis]|uniref:hypothetical protein n=1 Tax=Treponema pedis TaxID=409322 RepID=UPI003D2503C7